MKTPRKTAVKALASVPLLALALTSCSSEPQDPAAIMSEYVEHLNSGDFEAALELVHEPGDVSAGSIVKLEGYDIPQPTTQVEAFEDDVESQSVQFEIEGTKDDGGDHDEWRKSNFVKIDGEWLMEEPMFLTDAIDGYLESWATSEGTEVISESGTKVHPGSRIVTHKNQDVQLNVDFSGGKFAEAANFSASVTLLPTQTPGIRLPSYEDVDDVELVITDEFYQEIEDMFKSVGAQEMRGHYSLEFKELPPKNTCQIYESDGVKMTLDDGSFEVQCLDEGQANVEVTHLQTHRMVGSNGGASRTIEAGETSEGSATFIVEVEDGEVHNARYGNFIFH